MMEKRATILGCFLLINILGANCFARQLDSNHAQEPQCRSQFDYEYKVVKKIVALENICGDLKAENSELRTKVNELRAEIKTATNELQTERQTTANEFKEEIQAAIDEFKEEIQTAMSEMKVEFQTITKEIEDLKSKTAAGPKVAFLANMETSISVSSGSTILFETVITNVGRGYNVDDGMFTTPYDGIYQFSATMMTGYHGEIWAYFSLNGRRIAFIYGRASDQRHDQGANTIILQLTKGDRVCVMNRYTSTIWGDGYSTFSGNLLK